MLLFSDYMQDDYMKEEGTLSHSDQQNLEANCIVLLSLPLKEFSREKVIQKISI